MTTITIDMSGFSKEKRHGKRRSFLLRRTATWHLLLCLVGIIPALLHQGLFWQSFGLGLFFPGAGFLAMGGWWILLGVFIFILYLAGFFLWWASGNISLPLFIWIFSAITAGLSNSEDVQQPYALAVAALVILFYVSRIFSNTKKRKQSIQRRDDRNLILNDAVEAFKTNIIEATPASDRELTKEQLDALRFLFDLGDQPYDSFKGFDIIEQFQPSALRYQFNYVNYALGVLQSQWTPSFHGYLSQFQKNLNDKLTHRKVWRYWILERLWGRFSTNSDPAGFENIMLTGWSGFCLATYSANTRDDYFGREGALTFVKNKKVAYRHNIHTFAKSVYDNMNRDKICLYPCEPNWVYSVCNFYGAGFLIAYDRAYGTSYYKDIENSFKKNVEEEFVLPDGRIAGFFSNLTGLDIPVMGLGIAQDSSPSLMINPIMPEFALKNYALVRKESISFNEAGEIQLKTTKFDKTDVGNYKQNSSTAWCFTALAAAEQGDQKVVEKILQQIDKNYEKEYSETGAYRYKGVSTGVNAQIILAKLLQKNDWSNSLHKGPPESVFHGPVLTDCKYPEVLVAKAFSNGTDLDLVLYPGKGDGAQQIKIERLQPGRKYRIANGSISYFEADQKGTAILDVQLSGRSQFNIVPN